jgi:hypothetical protein
MPGRVQVSQELIPLLIGVEQPGAGHILHGGNRLDALATGQFLHRGLIGGWQLKCLLSVLRRHDHHLVLSFSHDRAGSGFAHAAGRALVQHEHRAQLITD